MRTNWGGGGGDHQQNFCRAKGHQDFKASGDSYAQVLVPRPQFALPPLPGDVVEDEVALASVLPLGQVEDNAPWGKKCCCSNWRRWGGHQWCCGCAAPEEHMAAYGERTALGA